MIATQPVLRRWRWTPLRDMVRGRITGRLDYRWRIEASGLSPNVVALLLTVVARTGLWRIEKSAVADELIDHFNDGLAAARREGEVIESFGDPQTAARLIGRAKRRARSVPAKLFVWSRRAAVAVVLLYGLGVVRFLAGRPTIAIDYLAEINRPALETPEAERAWPLWRQALTAATEPGPIFDRTGQRAARVLPGDNTANDDAYTSAVRDWVSRHAEDIKAFRVAASRARLGFILGPDGWTGDTDLFGPYPDGLDGPLVAELLLPQLRPLVAAGELLVEDARQAADAGDGGRFEQDVIALVGLGRQLATADHLLVTQQCGVRVWSWTIDLASQVLRDRPGLMDDAGWLRLAHALSGPRTAADWVDGASESAFVRDLLQRAYTDDGRGDGRLTADGLKLLPRAMSVSGQQSGDLRPWVAFSATVPGGLAGRADVLHEFDRLWDKARANLLVPVGRADWKSWKDELNHLTSSPLESVRYLPVICTMPGMDRVQYATDRAIGLRDGVVVAIGLELYRRHGGAYPVTLERLVPDFLPAVPVDRIASGPIRYRLIDGKPVIYSLGADGIDDGGRPPSKENRRRHRLEESEPGSGVKGDWVLFPPEGE